MGWTIMPDRIQLHRTKGWRMPAGAVKVDRSSDWGNPFRVAAPVHRRLLETYRWQLHPSSGWSGPAGTAEEAVRRFRLCLSTDDASIHAIRAELRGRDLACWCPPGSPCHADVLLEVANG